MDNILIEKLRQSVDEHVQLKLDNIEKKKKAKLIDRELKTLNNSLSQISEKIEYFLGEFLMDPKMHLNVDLDGLVDIGQWDALYQFTNNLGNGKTEAIKHMKRRFPKYHEQIDEFDKKIKQLGVDTLYFQYCHDGIGIRSWIELWIKL